MDKKTIYATGIIAIVVLAAVAFTFGGNGGGDDDPDHVPNTHAISLNGVVASEDNILNGTYEISRNLVLVTKGEPTGNVAAFLSWITGQEGQDILGREFVRLTSYTEEIAPSEDGRTTIVMGGSTSLSDTAIAFQKAYQEKYPFMSIEIQGGGSGAGEKQTDAGVLDIGMLSRDMGSKYEGNLVDITIGKDGVAVIANIDGVSDLTMDQVAGIFSGKYTNWDQVGGPDETIRVISREDGSGTRECFDKAMQSVDPEWDITTGAAFFNSTGNIITNVQNTDGAIGYISIGKLSAI